MSYRLSTAVRPLIWIEAVVEPYSHSRIEYLIKAKSQFKLRRFKRATNAASADDIT
jgi:AP-1 complex subunit mu